MGMNWAAKTGLSMAGSKVYQWVLQKGPDLVVKTVASKAYQSAATMVVNWASKMVSSMAVSKVDQWV